MSWYKEKANDAWKNSLASSFSAIPVNKIQRTYRKELSTNIAITNLKNEEDCEILQKALESLPGVVRVKSLLNQKKINITFNAVETNLTVIAHTIANLGYHHVQRG